MVTEAEYIAECKRLFCAGGAHWSAWEQDAAEIDYADGVTPQAAADRMSYRWACRRANRNV